MASVFNIGVARRKMAVWVVRAEKHGEMEDLALDQNLVVIGWRDLPDLTTIKSRDELNEICHKTYPDAKPAQIRATVGQCWAFANTIQVGELVVLPLKRRAAVAVGRVIGPYRYRRDLPQDAYHTRSVEWIRKDVPRSAFDPEILFSLGGLLTVFQIQREHAEERILAAASGQQPSIIPPIPSVPSETQLPPDLEEFAHDQIRAHIARNFRTHDLARLVDELLKAQGYQTQMSAPGPDGGVDIVAGRGPMGFDPPRLCVQVKSSDQPLDVHVLRELQGIMKRFGAQQGLLVSWGGYTRSVLNEARQQFFEIRLWDAGNLIDELLQFYDHLAVELQAELPLKRIWTLVQEDA